MALTAVTRRLKLRYKARAVRRWVGRSFEILRYAGVRPTREVRFHVVSCQRHAGQAAIDCLDSVYRQSYRRDLVRHLFIDDDSRDGTDEIVRRWLETHPDHSVDYRRNTVRVGGTQNTLEGIRGAERGSIILELNGDDWLPDPGVLAFLNKVYSDPDVWMTYNTLRSSGGWIGYCRPYSARVERANAYRKIRWSAAHLHSFRAELLDHLDETCMIDPQSGEYWTNADDQALYLTLLEMCGPRARHLYRVNYIYNQRHDSEFTTDGAAQSDRARRIRQLPPRPRLESLDSDPPDADPATPRTRERSEVS